MNHPQRSLTARLALIVAAAAVIPACGGRSGGGDGSSSTGNLTMLARGGAGLNGNGGSGMDFEIRGDSVGGDVEAYTTGSVNARVVIPEVKPALGANPRTVESDETWLSPPRRVPGDGPGDATGLWVKPGATLTITPNEALDFIPGNDVLWLEFAAGIYVEGTIVIGTKNGTDDTARLNVPVVQNVVITSTGKIDAGGRTGAGPTGGAGGEVTFYASGTIANHGTILSTGADGPNGGAGGAVYLRAENYGSFNDGLIDASGGRGTSGNGGYAGWLELHAGDYGAHNNGSLIARGGDGTVNGGNSNWIGLTVVLTGAATNAGTIDGSAGSSTDSGLGGSVDYGMDIDVHSGSCRLAGSLLFRGGNGGPNGGDGGDGGYFNVAVDGTVGFINANYVPEGVFVGADIDTSGGDGANGGDANSVAIENTADGYARPVGITFVGYSAFDCSSGDGTVNGGSNNYWSWFENAECTDIRTGRTYGGRIYNEVPFYARGGNGGTGDGGNGSYLEFWNDQTNVDTVPGTGIVNVAPLDCSGGDGAVNGGDGGDVDVIHSTPFDVGDAVGILNTGTVDLRGGRGTALDGGSGGSFSFEQDASGGYVGSARSGAVNRGTILLGGGAGGANGGDGGVAQFSGDFWIRNSGGIDCSGGAGGTGLGGDGGYCDFSQDSNTSSVDVDIIGIENSGNVSMAGGDGLQGGAAGNSWWLSTGHIVNSGALDGSGGTGTDSGGGSAGWRLAADTYIVNAGSITCSGGDGGTGSGGSASYVEVYAKQVTNSAALLARGGDAATTGGNGSNILVYSTEGGSALSGTFMDAGGGTGATDGAGGSLNVDGLTLDAASASLP